MTTAPAAPFVTDAAVRHTITYLTSALPHTSAVALMAAELADQIAYGSDMRHRGGLSAHQVHEAVVEAVALLAHRPGGVWFGGLHWCAGPCPDCPGPGAWALPQETVDWQARGVFFTPRELADHVTAVTLEPLTGPELPAGRAAGIEALRVADISCGSGAFLVSAARYLGDLLEGFWDKPQRAAALERYATDDARAAARALVAEQCLFGVDLDPLSVELAALALQLTAWPAVPDLAERSTGDLFQLRAGDALVGIGHPADPQPTTYPEGAARFDWPAHFPAVFERPEFAASGFDAVIGNPPYLGGLKIPGALGDAYRNHLIGTLAGGARGTADLAAYFWLRAHQLVSEWGVVGVVATYALVHGATARVGRDRLLKAGWRLIRTEELVWPSKSAGVACVCCWTAKNRFVPGADDTAAPVSELR
jgi:hypothetical protein